MKNLIKKILKPLTPLIFAGSLFVANPQPSSAETSGFNISGGVGGFNLKNDPQEIYGIFPRFKAGIGYSPEKIDQHISGRIECGVDVIYATRKGQPIEYTEGMDMDSSCRLSKITIQPRIAYYFNEKDKVSPYVGLTVPYVFATEEITATEHYYGEVESVTAKVKSRGMGIGGIVGINAPIRENLSFYAEGSYSRVNVKPKEIEINGESWEVEAMEKVNVGGLALDVGVKYMF